jgi:hypothetical protein
MCRTLQALIAVGMLAACTKGDPGDEGYPSLIALDPTLWAGPPDDGGAEALAARAARLRGRAAGLQTALP